MQELMKKLQELVDLFTVRLGKLNSEKQGVAIEKEGLGILKKELGEREKIIKVGEAKYKDIGDVAAYRESAQSLMNQARDEHGKAIKVAADFEKYKTKTEGEIANEKALIVKRNNELATGVATLEKDRKEYKRKITDEITRNLGK